MTTRTITKNQLGLLRIAKSAQRTYVGTHWPSMGEMRRDGIGHGLVDNNADEVKIRRFLYEFQPEFMVQYLETIFAALPEQSALDVELLARALWNLVVPAQLWLDDGGTSHDFATAIAAQYARLGEEE